MLWLYPDVSCVNWKHFLWFWLLLFEFEEAKEPRRDAARLLRLGCESGGEGGSGGDCQGCGRVGTLLRACGLRAGASLARALPVAALGVVDGAAVARGRARRVAAGALEERGTAAARARAMAPKTAGAAAAPAAGARSKVDLYALLKVDRQASASEVKKAYLVLALKVHPDKNPGDPNAQANFQALQEAYE
jgi:hypothetical protein